MKILAYTSPARGHLYPLTPIIAKLADRGHNVTLYSLASELGPYAELGIDAHPIDPRIEALEHDDYKARSPRKALIRGLSTFCDRAPLDAEDLHRAIAAHEPDVLLIDTSSYGACFVAEASGMPWATFTPFLLPLPSGEVPPFGRGSDTTRPQPAALAVEAVRQLQLADVISPGRRG
jgi:UDP:flavonoid glycosyltransferase YjiC (YdhE family)